MIQETFSEHNCICRTLIDRNERERTGEWRKWKVTYSLKLVANLRDSALP